MIAGAESDLITGLPRIEGFKAALHKNNLPLKEHSIIQGDFSYHSGFSCLKTIIKNYPQLTAIFAASDEMAIGAMNAAQSIGIKVPEQLAIIGLDNTQLANMCFPPLTTVEQDFYQMGWDGLNMLMDLMSGKKLKSKIMPHKIIERASVKSI